MTGRLRQGKRILLVVEDDPDTANLLSMFFGGHEFIVDVAGRGEEAVTLARRRLPDVILLDIGLPDFDGYAVCEELRQSPRTSHIPIIMLSEKTSLSDRVTGLGAGAQDYVTKPFDLEELRLRVQNLVARSLRENLVDPRTNLPTGPWIDDQLKRVRERAGWHALQCRIEAYEPFLDQNGFVAGDDVLKFAARLLREATDQLGTPEDFIGHPSTETFLILTGAAEPDALAARLRSRFNTEVVTHYNFVDRERGYILANGPDGQALPVPFMTLEVTTRASN
ncbi:MAG: response regulator [Anaerolineales bacterium]|nr:response regulator [Anaerolineales bacterium]